MTNWETLRSTFHLISSDGSLIGWDHHLRNISVILDFRAQFYKKYFREAKKKRKMSRRKSTVSTNSQWMSTKAFFSCGKDVSSTGILRPLESIIHNRHGAGGTFLMLRPCYQAVKRKFLMFWSCNDRVLH